MIENDIIVGNNNWLYLNNGTNNVSKYYTDNDYFSNSDCIKWVEALEIRQKKLKKFGIDYIHFFVPDKLSIYSEFLPANLNFNITGPVNKLFLYSSNLINNNFVINLNYYYNQVKNKYKLFWKTDTHWTFYGAFIAFQLILSKLNIEISNPLLHRILNSKVKSVDLILDLGIKLKEKPTEKFEIHNFKQNAVRAYANKLVIYNESNQKIIFHRGCNVIFKNKSKDAIQKKVIIFGDSYSEYREHLLTGLFAETFYEVHFVWSTSLDYSYIERVKPDILITESAERFMKMIPDDLFNLSDFIKEIESIKLEKGN